MCQSLTFKRQFVQVIDTMKNSTEFSLYFKYLDGTWAGCEPEVEPSGGKCDKNTLPCRDQCIGCGRYCFVDPDGVLDKGVSGADMIVEQIRQKCLWKYSHSNNLPLLWWQYLPLREKFCGGNQHFTTDCSDKAIAEVSTTHRHSDRKIGRTARNVVHMLSCPCCGMH